MLQSLGSVGVYTISSQSRTTACLCTAALGLTEIGYSTRRSASVCTNREQALGKETLAVLGHKEMPGVCTWGSERVGFKSWCRPLSVTWLVLCLGQATDGDTSGTEILYLRAGDSVVVVLPPFPLPSNSGTTTRKCLRCSVPLHSQPYPASGLSYSTAFHS